MNQQVLIDNLQRRAKIERNLAIRFIRRSKDVALTERAKQYLYFLSYWINPPSSYCYRELLACTQEKEYTIFGEEDGDTRRQEFHDALIKELEDRKKKAELGKII